MGDATPRAKARLFGYSWLLEAEPLQSVREIGFRCKIGFSEIGCRN